MCTTDLNHEGGFGPRFFGISSLLFTAVILHHLNTPNSEVFLVQNELIFNNYYLNLTWQTAPGV